MNTIKYPQLDHQECMLLLPSYINARLGSDYQRAVQEHIAQCSDCFNSLQEAKAISASLDVTDAPLEALLSSAAAKKSLMSTLDRIDTASLTTQKQAAEEAAEQNKVVELSKWRKNWNNSSQAMRRIVIAQAACLMVSMTFLMIYPFQPSVNYQTLSEPQQQAPVQLEAGHQMYRLVFHPESTEATIRNLLMSVDGKIVNGPSKSGVYDIAILNGLAQNEWILQNLRNSPWVKLAEPAVHRDGEVL